MGWILLAGAQLAIMVGCAFLLVKKIKSLEQEAGKEKESPPLPPIQVDVDTVSMTKSINERLSKLPDQIVNSITGTTNTHKGKLGELIGYIQIKAEYDRVIPLGTIVDFMALDFPKDGSPGKIVFLDIKTGKNARLTADQRQLKSLIESKNIEFVQVSIDSVDLLSE